MIYGPVTSQNNKKGVFLTDLVQGERVTMYVNDPINVEQSSTFTIKRVVYAYRGSNLGGEMDGNIGASEACNNNVACFYLNWQNPTRATGLIILPNGNTGCSGCLLNTTDNSFRPYFLTAFHCADTNQDDVLSNAERNNSED